jgi:hypothetical protein
MEKFIIVGVNTEKSFVTVKKAIKLDGGSWRATGRNYFMSMECTEEDLNATFSREITESNTLAKTWVNEDGEERTSIWLV